MATYTATTNPMIIAAAATVCVAGTGGTITRPINVKLIEWVGATAAGTFALTDLNGNVIVEATCPVTNQNVTPWPGPIKLVLPGKQASFASTGNPAGSWQVATLTSGTLLIWY
jgi:hypothetical protein